MMMNLPVLIADGQLTSLEKITKSQLEKFVPFMIKCSVGHNAPTMNDVPEWWPDELPFMINFEKPLGMTDYKWVKLLKMLVSLCYNHHGCDHMLHFCSSLAVLPQSSFKLVSGSDGTSSFYNRISGRLIVTFRNENMTYDKEPESCQTSLLSSRTTRHKDMLLKTPEIYLCENCDEEFTALNDIKYHEVVCKKGLLSSPLSRVDGSVFEDLINCDGTCIPQQNFLKYFGLVGECPMYKYINKNSYPEHSPQRRVLENVNLSRCGSIPIASPLGSLVYKHSLSSSILSQIHLDKVEKFCTTNSLEQLSCNRASKVFSGPWLCTWKPKYKDGNGSWAHTYHFYKHWKQSRSFQNIHGLNLRSWILLKKCKEATVLLERLTDAEIEYYTSRRLKRFQRYNSINVDPKNIHVYNEGTNECSDNTRSQMEYNGPQSTKSSDTRLIPNKAYTCLVTKRQIRQQEIPVIDLCTSSDESDSQTTDHVRVNNNIADEVIELEGYQESSARLPSSTCLRSELLCTNPTASCNVRNSIVVNYSSEKNSSDYVTLNTSEKTLPQWNSSLPVNNSSNGANQGSTENVTYSEQNLKNIKACNQSASISSTKSFISNGGAGTPPVSVFPYERFSKTKLYQVCQNSKSEIKKEFDCASYNFHIDRSHVKTFPKCNGNFNCDTIMNYTTSALDSTTIFSDGKSKRNIENEHPKTCKKYAHSSKNVPEKLSKELQKLMRDECANIRDTRFFKILKCNHKVLRKREIYVSKTTRTRSSGIPFQPLKLKDTVNHFTRVQPYKLYPRVHFHDRALKSDGKSVKIKETFKQNSSMRPLKRNFKSERNSSSHSIHVQSERSKNIHEHWDKFRIQKFMSHSSMLKSEPGAKFECKELNNQCASKSKLKQLQKNLNCHHRTLKLRSRTVSLNSLDKFVYGDSIVNSNVKTVPPAMTGLYLGDFVKTGLECNKFNCTKALIPSFTNFKKEISFVAPQNAKRSLENSSNDVKLGNGENGKSIGTDNFFANSRLTLNTQIFSKESSVGRESKMCVPCDINASSPIDNTSKNKKNNYFQEKTHFNSRLNVATNNIYKQICKPSRELKGILKDECKELVNLGLKRCNIPAKTSLKTCTLGSIYKSELKEIEVVHRQWMKEANIMCIVNFPVETGMVMVMD